MKTLRAALSCTVAAGMMLLAQGCGRADEDSRHNADVSGMWSGTWASDWGSQGNIVVDFTPAGSMFGSPVYDAEVIVSGPSCSSVDNRSEDYGVGSDSASVFETTVDWSVTFATCEAGLGIIFAGGIYQFRGEISGNQMSGTYSRLSDFCSCCVCGTGSGGTWTVSR